MIEDILKKHLAKSKCQHPLIGKEWDLVFEAMDEYAQQESRKEATDFLAWVMKQDFQWRPLKSDGDEWMIFDKVERIKKYTTNELYDLYLQSKQKQW